MQDFFTTLILITNQFPPKSITQIVVLNFRAQYFLKPHKQNTKDKSNNIAWKNLRSEEKAASKWRFSEFWIWWVIIAFSWFASSEYINWIEQ